MGLLDDLLGPLRDIASIKNEVVKEVTGVGETVKEVKDSITQPLETPAANPVEPQDSPETKDKS